MLFVTNAECHFTYKPFMLSVVMLNVVRLSVVAPSEFVFQILVFPLCDPLAEQLGIELFLILCLLSNVSGQMEHFKCFPLLQKPNAFPLQCHKLYVLGFVEMNSFKCGSVTHQMAVYQSQV
jgi:hypothetical protein